ncbi:tryptophan--trna ligase mitochondrial [Holotrichia oblita]|nr:tryptophan--trna ligase mitochondrial [Holotrichia oblita]
MQEEYNSYFCIVDLHSLTIDMDPEELRENTYAQLATFLACGLDPDKSTIFVQSHVSGHAELGWIMTCNTPFGLASRMTQFKDAKIKNKEISSGLFAYPMLMAADILLYDANVVPVGKDQVQHVEMARDVAIKFNSRYGKTFIVPEAIMPKSGAKIMGLLDPEHKMAKSGDNDNDVIYIDDSDEDIRKKFKRAVTDSLNQIKFGAAQPGVSNLLTIYSAMKNITIKEAEQHFSGQGYGALKTDTAEAVIKVLAPIRDKISKLKDNKEYLDKIAKQGADKARAVAQNKLQEVYDKIGLISIKG